MKTIKNITADELRKSILQLAIQGKLVKQDPNDEPASELVKRIYEEKNKLIAEGKIKKDKNQSYIFKGDDNCYYEKIGNNEQVKLEDLPFDIPDNWTWIRQKNICWLDNGLKTKGEKLPYLEAKVIRGLKQPIILDEGVIVNCNQRVILVDGENSGEIMTPPYEGYMGSTFKIFSATNFYNYNFLLFIFLLNKNLYKNSKVGAAIPHLNKDIFRESFIVVPPLAEQQRIVDKIKSFEPLLERYDKVEKELSKLEKEFSEKLKKSILQYAIEGKLVKQDPNDEPASVLLERIKQEKERLIKEGKIKRDKNESYIYQGDDKNYYKQLPIIPANWVYTNLGSLGTLTRGNGINRDEITQNGYPCVRYGELYTTYKTSFFKTVSFVNLILFNKSKKIHKNDIIMALTGENKEDISKAVAYLGNDKIAMGGDMTCFSNHMLEPLYLVYVLNSPYGISRKRELATGDIIIHMSNDKLSSIQIPLPPLVEQKKIIYKINTISQLLD